MTAPLLPTDGCPRCVTPDPVHPFMTTDITNAGLCAYYRCPACGHWWQTSWASDAANLPCPGCAVCKNEKGQVA
jgi:hypothetical protein